MAQYKANLKYCLGFRTSVCTKTSWSIYLFCKCRQYTKFRQKTKYKDMKKLHEKNPALVKQDHYK